MKAPHILLSASVAALAALSLGCDDDVSKIGNSFTEGDVNIYVDSLTFNLNGRGVENENYDSRSGNLLLGEISVPEYGKLKSSFVSRLMCVTSLGLPADLTVDNIDSCQLVMRMNRGDIVGDSLTPQKVSVYRLDNQIPDNINNSFDPVKEFGRDGMTLLGTKSFTSSSMGEPDSLFNKAQLVGIDVSLGSALAKEIFTAYKTRPEVFQWPQSFAKEFLPGIFVETSFGKGCVSNIQLVVLSLFYHTVTEKKETVDGVEQTKTIIENDTIYPFSISPEVLSSNNISYEVAQELKDRVAAGDVILTTPGGYNAAITFPAREILRRYHDQQHNLSLISDLTLTIPAEAVANDFGIAATPTLLLVKTSEVDDFFKNEKLPDNKTSFTASFDEKKGEYAFSSMRNYILNLLEKGGATADDEEFSIIPVYLKQESQKTDYYGNTTTYVTKCTPYTMKPTMTRLLTDKALVVFTFSSQKFE